MDDHGKWFMIIIMFIVVGGLVQSIYREHQKTQRIKYVIENLDKVSPETRMKLEGEILHIMNIEN